MLGHTFREQLTSDFGVDAHVEIKGGGGPTGRLVGLQLKTGKSHFGDEANDGWKFRPKKKHIPYWLNHSLPMYVLLIDKTSQTIYWQELSERTLERGPRGGVYVFVPRTQTLQSAGRVWAIAAEQFAQTAIADYSDNLSHLSPTTARRIQSLASLNADAAALLAAHLARGRGAPEVVVRTLLDSDPAWLSASGPSDGLGVLGDYAHSHDLDEIAVKALLRAAERDSAVMYRCTRLSGLLLLESDPHRARELLSSAAAMPEGASDPRIVVGQAILNHSQTSKSPVALSTDVEKQLGAIRDDDFILSFLARRYELAGDLDTAVKLTTEALALVPDAAGHMDALARTLGRRARTSRAQPADQKRALGLASDALDQIHSWAGPTVSTLSTLLTIQMSAGLFASALDRSLPSPRGRATNDESQRPIIRTVAATAAEALGKSDLAAELIDSLPSGVDQDFARLRSGDSLRTKDEQRTAWLKLVARLDTSRPDALVEAVLRLSVLGVDESARLDDLVDQNMISPDLRSVASLGAAAVGDLDAHVPALRILAERDEVASSRLIDLLLNSNRLGDAEIAADIAFARFGKPGLAVQRADVLARLGRNDEAQVVANDALGVSTIDPFHRRIAHRLLAHLLINQVVDATTATSPQLWQGVERHLTACVDAGDGFAPEHLDIWQLADAQMRLSEEKRAFQTLTNHEPLIASANEVRLWLSVMLSQPALGQHTYARMLDLADEYQGDPQLSAALLTAVTTRTRDAEDEPATPADERSAIDGDLRAAAFAALHTHVERHGDDSPIKILHAPTSEDLRAQMTDFMRRDDSPLVELVELIRQARLPLGMLSTAAHRPYASTVASRPLGYFISGAAIEEDDVADEEAARQALTHDVVLDISTLLIASDLDEYESFRGRFRSLLMPADTRDDIRRSRFDLDGRSSSSGWMAYDATTDSIAATELDIEQHLATLARFGTLEAAAGATRVVPNASITDLGLDLPGAEPWLAPIALAKERGLSFWSDDLAQRRLARVLGVATFGTTTLQQVRTEDQLNEAVCDDVYRLAATARRQEVLGALKARVVDVPTDSGVVIEQAAAEGWDESVALVTVGRPGWWHMAVNPWMDLQTILYSAQEAKASVDPWRYHAMWGVVRLATDDPIHMGTLVACVALLPTEATLDGDETVRHLSTATEIAALCGARPPAKVLTEAATTLATAGMLTYAPEEVGRLRAKLAKA